MISAILVSSLLLTLQTSPSASPADRLAAAEASHDTSKVISVLSELTDTLPAAPLNTLRASIPTIAHAASNADPHIRSLALLALIALTNRTRPDGSPSGDALPLLEPFLPAITNHINDPDLSIRQLTALFLGGFLASPAPAVISPLLSALASPAPPTEFDLSVIVALLSLGVDTPGHPEIPGAILTLLLRPETPPDLTIRILKAIGSHPRHSTVLDTSLLVFLSPARTSLIRAALIGILPHLALAQPDLEAMRTRLTHIATDPSEASIIRSTAAEVLSCWHTSRMSDPCPAPSVHYRMLPEFPHSLISSPHYRSPPLY